MLVGEINAGILQALRHHVMIHPGIHFEPLSEKHRIPVIDIYNYYIAHTHASFLEQTVPYEFYDLFLAMMKGYPASAVIAGSVAAGFCYLRPYNPMPAFSAAAEITYFIRPEMTGKGIGQSALEHLADEAKARGITQIIACVSSLNPQGIRFHQKSGFSEQGRLIQIGRKFNNVFDIIYFQKKIS